MLQNYEHLDSAVPKLRKKYNNYKSECRWITDYAKNGSSFAPEH